MQISILLYRINIVEPIIACIFIRLVTRLEVQQILHTARCAVVKQDTPRLYVLCLIQPSSSMTRY